MASWWIRLHSGTASTTEPSVLPRTETTAGLTINSFVNHQRWIEAFQKLITVTRVGMVAIVLIPPGSGANGIAS
jgi:hypothetical protein